MNIPYTEKDLYQLLPPPNGLWEDGTFFALFPELKILKDTPQDAIYHLEGDVWTHTKMVIAELLKSPEYNQAEIKDRFILFYAALFHDIGKGWKTKIEGSTISSRGHSPAGAQWVRKTFYQNNIDFDLRENISRIINNHQVPFFALNNNPKYTANLLSYTTRLDLLLTVSKMDLLGRKTTPDDLKTKSLEALEIFKLICEEENSLKEKMFPDTETGFQYFRKKGEISPDYPFFKDPGSEVILLSGLPASGKDNYIKQINSQKAINVISYDDLVKEMGLNYDNIGAAVHRAKDLAKEYLRKKENFIFNATNLTSLDREKLIDLFNNYQAQVRLIYLESPYQEIINRNEARNSSLKTTKIISYLDKFSPPTKNEAHWVEYKINLKIKNKPSL